MTDTPKPEKPKAKRPRVPGPHEVPYIKQGFTFADRQAELSLMVNLLDARKRTALEELDYVTNCINTRTYPGIVMGDE